MVERKQAHTSIAHSLSLFLQISDMLRRYLELELAQYKATPIRFAVLEALRMSGGTTTPSMLSKQLVRTTHTVTYIIDTLEKEGIVRRERDTNDRRSVKVHLTQRGIDKLNVVSPQAERISETALCCFNEDEIETLTVMFSKLQMHLDEQINKIDNTPQRAVIKT